MEPICDCLVCDETLPRHEQGRYTWCARCRGLWDEGFKAGVSEAGRLKELSTLKGICGLVEAVAPYTVKGYR